MFNAVVVEIREIEPGYGDRPDGFILAQTVEDLTNYISKSDIFKWSNERDYSVVNSDKRVCMISEEDVEKIKNSEDKILWILNKDYKNTVLALQP